MDNDSSNKTDEPVVQAPKPANKPTGQSAGGLAVAAMVVGIVGLVFCWVPFLGLGAGITAVVLGIIAIKKAQNKGMSIAGLVTGGIATLINLVIVFFLIAGLALFGGAATIYGNAVNEASKEAKAQDSAKKDFDKGETAKFGQFEVKVNSVKRDYVPENEFQRAGEGKELIVVNVTVTNTGDSKSFTGYDLDLSADGISDSMSFTTTVEPEFTGGTMDKGATATGNLVYEIAKGASDLKLKYESYGFDYTGTAGFKNYTYTLKI
ncbi:MAG TPA: DUF4190 domain-containing protein [Candidatus Saccharibacteria bacterium]|nr:DUF4190 domain-containing protein [Candidatus Saccharibacteria bacterium]